MVCTSISAEYIQSVCSSLQHRLELTILIADFYMLSTWVRKLFQSKFYKQTTFLWTENNYWNHHLFGFVGWKYSDDPSASLKVVLYKCSKYADRMQALSYRGLEIIISHEKSSNPWMWTVGFCFKNDYEYKTSCFLVLIFY
uniref:Uncharacterized protein n=1 Tax=Lepeophtheirus salmonis TaxID=72036 RepID=A0A0K2UUE3_LEPSM